MNRSASIIIGVIVVILIVLIGWWAFAKNADEVEITPTPDVTVTPTPTPTPNPVPPVVTQTAGVPTVVTSQNLAPSDTTVVLTGKVTPNGAFTSYWYDYGTSASLGKKTTIQMIGSGFSQIPTPAYITGLSANTTYFFRLSAENQFGTVSGLQYSFKTTQGTPPPVGSVPTVKTVAASVIAKNSANLNGEVTPNKQATWYWFEYGKTNSLGTITSLQSIGDGTSKMLASAPLTGLEPSTTYFFRLNAQNQFGTINGSILSFKTLGPPLGSPSAAMPSVNTKDATKVSSTTATLQGETNPNGLETSYWFEYGTNVLLVTPLLKTTPEKSVGAGNAIIQTEAKIDGLISKTTYHFRLVSQNNLGTSRGNILTFNTK